MKEIILCDEFHIELDREKVLRLMDCYPDSPVYQEAIEEYEELKPIMLEAVEPKGIMCFGMVPSGYEVEGIIAAATPVIYTIITIGAKASGLSSRFFDEGDYLKGMLADVMADSCVFSMETDLKKYVKNECKKRGVGISHRYEAPVDVPMTYQKLAHEQCQADKYLNMGITVGYMLDPLKSNCQVFTLSDDASLFKVEHDCRHCENINCKLRNIPDTFAYIYDNKGVYKQKVTCKYGESILEAYTREGGYISAPCGGNGICGKCRIRVRAGELPITKADESYFSEKELTQGYRLSCEAYPEMDCEIELCQGEENDFSIVGMQSKEDKIVNNGAIKKRGKIENAKLAIDIGTTTLAISLVDEDNQIVQDTYTAVNHQRVFGADVISRIQASNEGKGDELRATIQEDLLSGIKELCQTNSCPISQINHITIAANTTMTHLLLGFSCEGLGVVPFTPVNISMIKCSFEEVFGQNNGFKGTSHINVTFLPGISTYVGGDIVSGIYAQEMHKSDTYNILVDLGTNGEMAIGNKDRILVTSTAMGPACEGGNITYGMGGVSGAISNVTIDEKQMPIIKTIGDKEPLGICGTGVLETVAELIKSELIDETGLLEEDYFDHGYPLAKKENGEIIAFTQKDIREIQLAKAAVRAGIETLIKRAGITYEKVDKIYLAGGFGFFVDKRKAVELGLFPIEFIHKIETVGNTSLSGAIKYSSKEVGDVLGIIDKAEEISLSVDKYFNQLYVDHMFF